MSDVSKATVHQQWWLALPERPWASLEELLDADIEFWTAMLTATSVEMISVRLLQEYLHVLLPRQLRSPVRAWLTDQGLTLAHQPARWLADMPVFVAEREVR